MFSLSMCPVGHIAYCHSWFCTVFWGHLCIYFLMGLWSLQCLFPEVSSSVNSLSPWTPASLALFDYTTSSYSRWKLHIVLPQILFLWLDTLGRHPCWIPQALRIVIRRGDKQNFLESPSFLAGLGAENMLSDWVIYWIKGKGKMGFDRCGIGSGLRKILLTIQVDWLSLNRESFMETLWHISWII